MPIRGKPLRTAPKDGRHILLRRDDGIWFTGRYVAPGDLSDPIYGWVNSVDGKPYTCTHWYPIGDNKD